MTWRNWLMAIMGAWFVVSAWALNPMHSQAYLWTAVILGGLVLIGSIWELSDFRHRNWLYYLEAVFGLYLALTPWFYNFSRHGWATGITAILGVLMLIGGLWQAWSSTDDEARAPTHRAA